MYKVGDELLVFARLAALIREAQQVRRVDGHEACLRAERCGLSFPKISSAGDLATRLSLLCGKQFPVSSRKSPVQVRREFWRKQLTLVGKPSRLPAFAARSAKFPCIFPLNRENSRRDAFADDCLHSQPVAGFLALSQFSANSPEEGRSRAFIAKTRPGERRPRLRDDGNLTSWQGDSKSSNRLAERHVYSR